MSRPLFSVLMPTYNRRETLERVLAAYERQTPRELPFEVVVIDDGSTDGTEELLASWRPRRYAYRFARQANAGPAAARNRGLEQARGELVLFTGDDIEPSPRLLAEHWAGHQAKSSPGAVILGLIRWPRDSSLTATMRHVDGKGAQQFSFHFFEDGAEYDFRHFYTSNVSIRRSLLDREPSYFSTDFPAAAFEDAELAYRLSHHGARIFYRASAEAYHHHHYTVRSFFRRQERCGEMAMVLYLKWPQLEKWTGLGELSWRRLEAISGSSRVRAVAGELAYWERRLLAFAAFFDPFEAAPVDELFLEVFRYGYLRGLAGAAYGEETARRVLAAHYLALVPGAVRRFAGEMAKLRLPCPAADRRAIEGLACQRS